MKNKTIQGAYYNIFGITILGEDYSNFDNYSTEKQSAFLHERIHYIQNFSTVYGINQSLYQLSRFLGMISKISEGTFPLEPFDSDEQDFIRSLHQWSRGDSLDSNGETIKCNFILGISEEDNFSELYADTFPGWTEACNPQIILTIDGGKKYEFGGAAISESMSYLFERCLFESNDYEYRLPYNAAEMVYEYIMGKPCKNITVLIALCYVSLMSLWSGNVFVELLNEIKEKHIEPSTMNEIFQLAENKIMGVEEGILEDLLRKIDLIFPVEKENPIQKYEADSLYSRNWLKKRYRFNSANEQEFRSAIVYVLEKTEAKSRLKTMANLLDEYGQSLVIDANGSLYDSNEKELVHLLAPYALWGIIMEHDGECKLYSVCNKAGVHIDENCRNQCWKHERINDICILRYYLYKLGLGAVQFEQLEGSPFY